MTDFFVRRYTDYPDLRQYLQGYAITEDRLANLGVNTSVLLAEDDPVIPIADLNRVARPQQLTIDRSEFGGHCGFIGNAGSGSWLDSYLLDRLA
jgi:predicted alpha/beta-fold hydrolase